MTTVNIRVNGQAISQAVDDRLSLADFVRDQCLLTGTHIGCEHGVCGACTVLMDGKPIRSCITLAVAADGAEISDGRGLSGRRPDGGNPQGVQSATCAAMRILYVRHADDCL